MNPIVKPIIILGAPRSGTTILQRAIMLHEEVWHLRGESHAVLEGPFHPSKTGYRSNRCTAGDTDDALTHSLRRAFYRRALNVSLCSRDPGRFLRWNRAPARIADRALMYAATCTRGRKPAAIRFVEKTPKNTLRVPLLNELFPDARFIHLQRDPRENVDSLVDAWLLPDRPRWRRRPRFATYPVARRLRLQDYRGRWWRFALVPEWLRLTGQTVADVAAWQYHQCNAYLARDLAAIPVPRVYRLSHEAFVQDPVPALRQILAWADLERSEGVEQFARSLPRINGSRGLSPDWRSDRLRHPAAVDRALQRLGKFASPGAPCSLGPTPHE
jgi:hypothetical protein